MVGLLALRLARSLRRAGNPIEDFTPFYGRHIASCLSVRVFIARAVPPKAISGFCIPGIEKSNGWRPSNHGHGPKGLNKNVARF
jgi:hypothetical protein